VRGKRTWLGEELEVGGGKDIKVELRNICMRRDHQHQQLITTVSENNKL
jgi:hypothetical protein